MSVYARVEYMQEKYEEWLRRAYKITIMPTIARQPGLVNFAQIVALWAKLRNKKANLPQVGLFEHTTCGRRWTRTPDPLLVKNPLQTGRFF